MAPVTSTSALNLDPITQPLQRTSWEPQTDHADEPPPHINGHANGHASSPPSTPTSPTSPEDPNSALAAISLNAFLLGASLSFSFLSTLYLASQGNPLWRLPFFLNALSLFHFLEYYTTARYNPLAAGVNAFLLSQNGWAYNVAHSMAFLECGLHWYFYPGYELLSDFLRLPWLALGFTMLVVGQTTRTMAMAHAGSNFNHLVQSQKKEGHELVTDGIYAFLRHPSYFGFFWWGLGTQVVLGNGMCLVAYSITLWRFFRHRIEKEERFLIHFFGYDYMRYREKTRTGIPFL